MRESALANSLWQLLFLCFVFTQGEEDSGVTGEISLPGLIETALQGIKQQVTCRRHLQKNTKEQHALTTVSDVLF